MSEKILEKKMRKTLVVLLFAGWALGNFDRYIMNYAIVFIGDDLSLTATQTGLVLSSFFLGYALMQMPGGVLADKYGAKRILIISIIAWSIFTGLTAIAWSLGVLIIIRFLFGIGEGGFQPSASKVISSSFPKNERSKVLSIMLSTAGVMGVIIPIISSVLLVSIGWRPIFLIVGLFGLLIAFLYWKFIPNLNDTEQSVETQNVKGIFKKLFKMPIMWSLLIAYFSIYAVNWGLSSWLPKYLTDVRGLDLISIGWLQVVPGIIGIVAMLVCGYLLDKFEFKLSKAIGAVCALIGALFILLMFETSSIALFITYQCVIILFMTYVILLLPSIVVKYIPSEYTGTASGMSTTGGQLAGFVTPTLIGLMVDAFDGSYNAAMWLLVAFGITCMIAILTMSTKQQISEEDGHEQKA